MENKNHSLHHGCSEPSTNLDEPLLLLLDRVKTRLTAEHSCVGIVGVPVPLILLYTNIYILEENNSTQKLNFYWFNIMFILRKLKEKHIEGVKL